MSSFTGRPDRLSECTVTVSGLISLLGVFCLIKDQKLYGTIVHQIEEGGWIVNSLEGRSYPFRMATLSVSVQWHSASTLVPQILPGDWFACTKPWLLASGVELVGDKDLKKGGRSSESVRGHTSQYGRSVRDEARQACNTNTSLSISS